MRFLTLTALAALMILPTAAFAAKLNVADPWAVATTADLTGPIKVLPPSTNDTTASMTLLNQSNIAVTITGFNSPNAKSVMAHDTNISAGGVATMKPIVPLTIDPGKSFTFFKRGAHLMLMGLTKPLAPGDKFPVIIEYNDGTTQTVEVTAKR